MSHEQLVVFSAPPPCSPIMSKATFQQADPCPVISSSTSSTTMMANICTRGTAPGLPLSAHHRVTSSQGAQRREQFQCAKLSPDDPPVEAQHSCSETSDRLPVLVAQSPDVALPCCPPSSQASHSSSSPQLRRTVLTKRIPDKSISENDDVELRRSSRHLRHAQSEVPSYLSFEDHRRCSQSLTDAKEHAYARLKEELTKAQQELKLRDEECEKLSKVRYQMEEELEDLTASLFEEANRMVQEAHIKRINTEKLLTEANEKIEVLQAEVAALKQLVLTSTPSAPNKHLHPQICDTSPKKEKGANSKPFWKSHRRSTSHHEFTKEQRQQPEEPQENSCCIKETDSVCFDEFQRWKLQASLSQESPFMHRVVWEDIQPCLNFRNKQLSQRVQESVEGNTLTIEPIPGDSSYPRKCCLSETNKLCNYKIKLQEDDEWYSISQMCRNRIAAVCDFYTYIRYIVQGLVKSADKEMFQEIVRLRMQMSAARLGC
ncbi:guanine nucleotide exchange factor for Rab-3A-like isoform X2 [Pomacea canaliculata]|uniref:guanine nucleotide exchange factor for Rab-3A-like isoform X2 n=3 Tax=Pomacea canaliculata TaxID=400727 RepID=UPI000D7382AF|nr:guanine nucleotide exchange factor for Rab-3A-like isoform X2 [Pomacea canaliculata]XP_025099266.1 guanine nucleotide exchange factor for Rab-3A-like isoform X2 [Pomacea canaliculata]